ncbi:MAG TPA: transglutaminaseTgpA domain-containing protein [Micromonosporaceae bacterium]|nr:transglutaminaseTgpA domain-containing protein [Micromonosporaceae bacterium]
MVRVLRSVAAPLVLVTLIGLSGVVLGRIYAGPLLAQLVLGAAVGSVGVSLAARRLPSWLVAPLSVLALVAYAAAVLRLTAQRAELSGPLGEILLDAVRNGIPRLLTAMIPVEPLPDTVVVPLVAAWLTGLAGAEVALRASRTLLGYLPPALLYAGSLYVVGPNADPAIWPTVGFAAAAVLGLTLDGRPAASPAVPTSSRAPVAVRARQLAGAVAAVTTVVALVAGVAPLVAARVGHTPIDPRRYVQPPRIDSLDESPLIRLSGWALNPDQKLFELKTIVDGTTGGATRRGTGSGGAAAGTDGGPMSSGIRVRLAVLPDYDGVTWQVGGVYRNAGRVLPPTAPQPGAVVDTVRQEISIAGLTGRLLPAVPTAQEVTGARVAYDPESGTLIHPEGLTPGLRYTVMSARERPDPNLLSSANVPSGEQVARVLRLDNGIPEQLQRLAAELSAENGAPFERALAIEQFLAEHYRLVVDAPTGHAYPNLSFFLFGPRHAGGQRGTSEQFAAAYAVLGRLMGLPTRVVVGFRSATGSGPVLAGDAYAWPEVLFDELGWVPFDPLPRPDSEPRPVEEDFRPKPEKSTTPPTPEPPPTGAPTPSAPPAAAGMPERRDREMMPALVGGGIGLLLTSVAFVAVVVALRHSQRRRRLHAGTPAQRVAGSWLEVLDALQLAGRPAAGHLTATEVAAHARAIAAGPKIRPAVPPIDDLAALVNRTGFAPGAATEEQARMATAQAVAYSSGLRAGQRWLRRLIWVLHPGPLRWRR